MNKLSIVVPVFFEEANLPDTVPRLLALRESMPGYELELVFVDDGSKDCSVDILCGFQKEHPGIIKIIKLTRNFGSFSATQAGVALASGDCVGIIAADLQDPPELFVEMLQHWEKGIKAVFAVRSDRDDKASQKFFASAFYFLMRRFAIHDYPPGGFDFFLVDRQIVREINDVREKNTNLMSLIFWLGHTHVTIPYVRGKRRQGESGWTFAKKIKLFIDTFVSFSYLPIRFMSAIGALLTTGGFLYGLAVFIVWAAGGLKVADWNALMIFVAFTVGLQMMMLGVLGEYLWRTLEQTRQRPTYVVEQVIE